MLTSFTIAGHPVHVYLTEDEARNGDIFSAFVFSLEEVHEGLHCDNVRCKSCPIVEACDEHNVHLPFHLVSLYVPYLITDHPEYFI